MERAVYEERKKAEVEAYEAAAKAVKRLYDAITDDAMRAALDFSPRGWVRPTLAEAEAMLRQAAVDVAHLGDRLFVYGDPDFYKEVLPSAAKDDGGQFARNGLEYVFSE